jgi:two-component system, NarL family, invasion response regulator UvrY
MDVKVLLADDHSMIRKGLKLYLQMNLGLTDITEASNCNELMKELVKTRYTHLILDIILADGNSLEVIPNIKRVYPELNIMMFSMQPAEVYGEALKFYGINYYLSKSSAEEEILHMLKVFLNNEVPGVKKASYSSEDNPFSSLAPRELEILHYLLKGMGTKNIAETLNLKMNTISTMKARIFDKTNTVNIRELLDLASLYHINY